MPENVVFKISDYIESDLDWEAEQCRELGVEFCSYRLDNEPEEVLIENLKNADFIVVNMAAMNRKVMCGLPSAKVIVRHGAGYDNLDLAAATENGIICAYQSPHTWPGTASRVCWIFGTG